MRYESFLGSVPQYSGDADIDGFCENGGYLIDSEYFDVRVKDCKVVESDFGVKVGVIEGEYSQILDYGSGEIVLESEREYLQFKVASLKTKSPRWP